MFCSLHERPKGASKKKLDISDSSSHVSSKMTRNLQSPSLWAPKTLKIGLGHAPPGPHTPIASRHARACQGFLLDFGSGGIFPPPDARVWGDFFPNFAGRPSHRLPNFARRPSLNLKFFAILACFRGLISKILVRNPRARSARRKIGVFTPTTPKNDPKVAYNWLK